MLGVGVTVCLELCLPYIMVEQGGVHVVLRPDARDADETTHAEGRLIL